MAKTGVERATLAVTVKLRETDEATAKTWIDQQLKTWRVKLI